MRAQDTRHTRQKSGERPAADGVPAPSPAVHPLAAMQRAMGNAAVSAALDRRAVGEAGPGAEPDAEDVESEFRLGTAAALERVVNNDLKDLLGADRLHLSIGGGGGVAALRRERPVQDLDLRLHVPGRLGEDREFRQELMTRLKAILQDDVDDSTGTTVRGSFGGVEVSITLGQVPMQTRSMYVHDSTERVALTVVDPLRLFTDKVTAFAGRKEKEGEDLAQKRGRDLRDLLTLYPQVTAGRELADVLAEHTDDAQRIHQGLKSAGRFNQELGRFRKAHEDSFGDQDWEVLHEVARALSTAAKAQTTPKAGITARQTGNGPADPSGAAVPPGGAAPSDAGKADRKADKKARRQQKLTDREQE